MNQPLVTSFGFPIASKPVWGITGGIGSGKSTVGKLLAQKLGGNVLDADHFGHFALRDPQVRDQVVSWGGVGLLDESGNLCRVKLGKLVFPNPEKLATYESIIHPWIRKRITEAIRHFEAQTEEKWLILDASLLWESGWHQSCLRIIHVESSFEERRKRVESTRGWTREMLILRESHQMPLTLKALMADYCVSNSGSLDLLVSQLDSLLTRVIPLGQSV